MKPAPARGLVCLDYDGVLVDSLAGLVTLMERAWVGIASGRPPTADDFARVETLTFAQVARRCGVADRDVPGYAAAVFALQRADRSLPALFEGVGDMLAALARHHHLAVVTASHGDEVRRVLGAHGVLGHVSLVLDGTGHGDKARHIVDAVARFAVPAARTWMVGDAQSDIRAAHQAGVSSIAVTWGYQPRERLLAASPGRLAERPAEIAAMLDAGG